MMRIKIIAIGNSRGIRIPNHILKLMNIDTQIDMVLNSDSSEIILKPVHSPRAGWKNAFQKMKAGSHDKLLIDDSLDIDNWA